jgi:hypothetical protein
MVMLAIANSTSTQDLTAWPSVRHAPGLGPLDYCPGYRHKLPPLDHIPPEFAHACSGEGSEPGCETIAHPARIDNSLNRATTVQAILMFMVAVTQTRP